ncbi:MAG: hypothetical protein LBK64_05995, partial [Spirochaetaceae bacterium]|nr:hypothetical protein [Spirochaetaceae bacterium]
MERKAMEKKLGMKSRGVFSETIRLALVIGIMAAMAVPLFAQVDAEYPRSAVLDESLYESLPRRSLLAA